ncbi:hypothetical protein QBC47DRAFT_397756 [Echria macrotheca]|uniref:Uncharacterized protein n=1 Tax=Echria macrotheca TaxID=438768 RepID=A0AAJ0BJ63_9PEZI|nr:hypothetical protein QBC47DRAFT_397756 [Echria macrotheca]
MERRHLALVLHTAASFIAVVAGQFISGPVEPAQPALPHTAVYTTTVAQNNPYPAIATVVVTLIMPRDVGYHAPSNRSASLTTGTAISHFSAAQQNGSASTWSETTELVWTTRENDSPSATTPPQTARTALTASYTDYQHSIVALYGAWAVMFYNLLTTIRETVVETVDPAYPTTIVRTGYTDVNVAQTITVKDGPTTTDPHQDSGSLVRTTTMVLVTARSIAGE